MSVHALVQAAVRVAVEGHAPLVDGVTAVFDALPARGLRPFAVVEEPLVTDWSTKDMAGREARIAVLLFDEGESPVRLRGLVGEAERAVEGMARDLGEGWRIVSLVFVRTRIVRERDTRWVAGCEWRMRILRES